MIEPRLITEVHFFWLYLRLHSYAMDKKTICYVSACKTNLSLSDYNDLFNISVVKNELNNVYGVLIYHQGKFLQIIEGEDQTINDLFKKIEVDPRHYSIIKILDEPINTYHFKTYKTGFNIVNTPRLLREFNEYLNKNSKAQMNIPNKVRFMLNKFTKYNV